MLHKIIVLPLASCVVEPMMTCRYMYSCGTSMRCFHAAAVVCGREAEVHKSRVQGMMQVRSSASLLPGWASEKDKDVERHLYRIHCITV